MNMRAKRNVIVKESDYIRKSPVKVNKKTFHVNYSSVNIDLSPIGFKHYANISVFERVDENGCLIGYKVTFLHDVVDENGNVVMEDNDLIPMIGGKKD